jgi:hypothetical protein
MRLSQTQLRAALKIHLNTQTGAHTRRHTQPACKDVCLHPQGAAQQVSRGEDGDTAGGTPCHSPQGWKDAHSKVCRADGTPQLSRRPGSGPSHTRVPSSCLLSVESPTERGRAPVRVVGSQLQGAEGSQTHTSGLLLAKIDVPGIKTFGAEGQGMARVSVGPPGSSKQQTGHQADSVQFQVPTALGSHTRGLRGWAGPVL